MRKLLGSVSILALLSLNGADAQTGQAKTGAALKTEAFSNLATGQSGGITALELRNVIVDMLVSYPSVYSVDGFPNVDCTGATDSASGLQAAINAIPDASLLYFPSSCTLHIGSTVTITDRVALTIGNPFINAADTSAAPQILWSGANNGMVFDIEHSDSPRVTGLRVGTTGNTVNTFVNIDGCNVPNFGCTGTGIHPGTRAEVDHSQFISSGMNNPNYRAISISATITFNHENSYVHDNNIQCDGGQNATIRAIDGVVTNGQNTLTSATAAFVAGDVNKRVRLTFPSTQGGIFFDGLLKSVTNGPAAVLNGNVSVPGYIGPTRTGVQITTGTNFGVGIYQGRSQNAKHSRFYANTITGCN